MTESTIMFYIRFIYVSNTFLRMCEFEPSFDLDFDILPSPCLQTARVHVYQHVNVHYKINW